MGVVNFEPGLREISKYGFDHGLHTSIPNPVDSLIGKKMMVINVLHISGNILVVDVLHFKEMSFR